MDIFPAIDISDGKCVRLYQGDFEQKTVYGDNPLEMIQHFAKEGAKWVHVVDLDGARSAEESQTELLLKLAKESPLPIQVGGGLRDVNRITDLLDGGVRKVVIGSMSVKKPEMVRDWIWYFGASRVVVALDVNIDDKGEPHVATHGWQQSSGQTMWDVLEGFVRQHGLLHLLCTDIGKDGTLQGPNIELYKEICHRYPDLSVQASGGVSSLDNLQELKSTGVTSVVIGKALYEKKFTLKEALEC